MADKELRKLKRRDLLQMLLVQCEETERLQQESDEIKIEMDAVMESYERLKKKLDVKDERLNQKDAQIAELKLEIEELRQEIEEIQIARATETEENGSFAGAAQRISAIFEEAQRTAEQYLISLQKGGGGIAAKTQPTLPARTGKKTNPFEPGRIAGIRKKQHTLRPRQVVQMRQGQPDGVDRKAASIERNEADHAAIAAASGDIYG